MWHKSFCPLKVPNFPYFPAVLYPHLSFQLPPLQQDPRVLHPVFPDSHRSERCPSHKVRAEYQASYTCRKKRLLLGYFPCLVLCIVLFVFKQSTWSFSDNFSLVIFSYSLPQQHPQSYLINRDVMTSLHNNSKYHHRKHRLINDTITAKMKTSAPERTQWVVLCLVEQIIFVFFFFPWVLCFVLLCFSSCLLFFLIACDRMQEMYISGHRNTKHSRLALPLECRSTQFIFFLSYWVEWLHRYSYTHPFFFWYC